MKIAILHMTMGLVDRGSEVVTDLLATSLSARHQVVVIQSGKTTQGKKYRVKRVMPLSANPQAAPRSLFDKLLFRAHLDQSSRLVTAFTNLALPSLLRFDPDIVVAVNGGSQIKLLKKYLTSSKIAAFGHAGIGHDDLANLRAKPNLFIALSQAAKTWAKEQASGQTRVVYIPNPIDTRSYLHVNPIAHHLPSPVVLVVGALSAYKNVKTVVAAAKELSASLILVGDGEEESQVASLLSSYPTHFIWKKHVEPKEMPSIYKSADAFCFVPDQQEAFGRVYLEAMAAKLPIVASNDPIRRDLVGKQGFFADPHNMQSVVTSLSQALAEGPVDYTSELTKYSLSHVVKQIEKEFYAL